MTSQSDTVLAAGDALTTDVFNAYLDGAYSAFSMRLYTAHNALTTQMWLVRTNRSHVDGAPASKVTAAASKCQAASQAFGAATTPAQRRRAVTLTYEAIDAINAVLPPQLQNFV
jgi:hypothetical protein